MQKHGKLMKSTPRESRCGARALAEYNYIMSANQFLLRLEKKKSAYFLRWILKEAAPLHSDGVHGFSPSLQQLLLLGGLHNTFAACEALNPYPFHLMVQAVAPCMQPES